MPLRPRHARIAGRTELADQAQLLERRLELGAHHPPLDPLCRCDRRLDGRPLAVAAEVRAQARPQVACPADVEDLVVAAEEEVDAGPGRRPEREVALVEQAARPRRGERREVRDGAGAALLREPDQREQQLCRRARIRQRSVARPLRRAEKPCELAEPEARDAPGEERPREPHGVDDGEPMREPVSRSVSRSRNARSKRALCATRTASPAKARKRRTASAGARRAAQLLVPQSGHGARSGGDRKPRIDERLELGLDLEAAQAYRSDLADPGPAGAQSRRLEVDDDVGRVLEQESRARRLGERDGVAAPGEPGIGLDDICEQRAGEGDRRLAEGEEPPRCVLREDRPALLLHELHEAVGRV